MRILANMLGVQTGGARTYLLQMLRFLADAHGAHECVVLASPWVEEEWNRIKGLKPVDPKAVSLVTREVSPAYRIYFDQIELPRLVRRESCDLLWSANNYGCFRSPVPQLLMQCNPTFFSDRYAGLLQKWGTPRERVEYWLRRKHVRQSVARADVTVFPTRAFMDWVLECLGPGRVPQPHALHHGFDSEEFVAPGRSSDRSASIANGRPLRLFYPTSWAPHKNFSVLFDALEILHRDGVPVELWLPLSGDERSYRGPFQRWMRRDFSYLRSARVAVRWLGYQSMSEVVKRYSEADLIVFPSWLETFGYPLVEAKAARRPLVASDTATNREVAGSYAIYHSPFDPGALAAAIIKQAPQKNAGSQEEDKALSWSSHFDELFALMAKMV